MHSVRRGEGPPLVLIHGLGSSHRAWDPVLPALAAARETVAVDLPGHGATPPLAGETSIATMADALVAFLHDEGLRGADVAGSSMGARLVLELARRREVGAAVALDPGGFWSPVEKRVFGASVWLSARLVRALRPALPALTRNGLSRSVLLAQFSARPWRVPAGVALQELRTFATAPSFDEALRALVSGPDQEGMAPGAERGPITIGWGRRDLVCLPRQARRALARFPDARLHLFARCGHFPQWDVPHEAARLILSATGPEAARPVSR